jgi:hypothetical protein
MKDYEFILKYALPDHASDPEQYLDALYEAGCDDALIGIGLHGRLALDFTRKSTSALDAITSAMHDVKKAIPMSRLIEATPDLVGISDLAALLGHSRQNMRKIVHKLNFPNPMHAGSTPLWHLYPVLDWFKTNDKHEIDETLIETLKEVSGVNMRVNVASQMIICDSKISGSLEEILH